MFVVFDKFDAPKVRNKNEKSKDFRKNILHDAGSERKSGTKRVLESPLPPLKGGHLPDASFSEPLSYWASHVPLLRGCPKGGGFQDQPRA